MLIQSHIPLKAISINLISLADRLKLEKLKEDISIISLFKYVDNLTIVKYHCPAFGKTHSSAPAILLQDLLHMACQRCDNGLVLVISINRPFYNNIITWALNSSNLRL